MKKIINSLAVLLALLVLPFIFGSQDAKAAEASTTSTLHLTILPAAEIVNLGSSSSGDSNQLIKEFYLGIRANTDWALSFAPVSYGFVSAASCTASRSNGPSNGRAGVGDGYQLVSITCIQLISWGDYQDGYLEIAASVGPTLGL